MTSVNSSKQPRVTYVSADAELLHVTVSDGRRLSLPLEWYPRLSNGTPAERNNWRLIGRGEGVHWPDLDEDLSLEGLLLGRKSGESPASLKFWRDNRKKGRKVTFADDMEQRTSANKAPAKRKKSA
jgi:hypothetical protein